MIDSSDVTKLSDTTTLYKMPSHATEPLSLSEKSIVWQDEYNLLLKDLKALESEIDTLQEQYGELEKQIEDRTISGHFINKSEIAILERIVEAEAIGEDIRGKELIAEVILNRIEHEAFPHTVEHVVFAELSNGLHEFSPIDDGRYYSIEVTEETKIAVSNILNGGRTDKAVLFFQATYVDGWMNQNRELAFTYGGHNFYY